MLLRASTRSSKGADRLKLPEEFDLEPRIWADPPAGVPEGGMAFWKEMRDGARIRLAFWQADRPRGTVIIFPGRTEFIEKYGETVAELRARNLSAFVIDWRGQGLSHRPLANPLKGHIDRIETFVEDFKEIMPVIEEHLPAPYLMLCHSMGGNIGLRVLAAGIGSISGAVFSAPMLGLQMGGVPKPLVKALSLISSALGMSGLYIPGGTDTSVLEEAFNDNTVTHDVIRFGRNKKYVADEPGLALGPPTLGWLNASLASIDYLSKRHVLENVMVPTLFFGAAEEALTDNAALEHVTGALKDTELVMVPGARHEILQEVDEVRETFWEGFDRFVEKTIGGNE